MSSLSAHRRELKYLLGLRAWPGLLARWQRHLVKAPFTNEHALSPVLSLYYDSPDLCFYREKLDGLPHRQKVRLRTYGHEFRAGQTTILEIKYRNHDLVRKRRHRIAGFNPAQRAPDQWRIDDVETRGAFEALRLRYRLRPTAQVYYQREAYEGIVEQDVRITLDTCLLGLHPGERPTGRLLLDRSRGLMPETVGILEIKATRGIPGWIHEGIVAAELEQRTIPKYVTAVESLGLPQTMEAGIYA